MMNKRVIAGLGLLIVIAVGLVSLMPPGVKPVVIGDQARAFSLPNLEGKIQGLPEGKVVLLNFWATWCPPCRQEVPSMVELYDKYKDQGFEIVAVSVDKGKKEVVDFVKEQNMDFTVLHDASSAISQSYAVFRYPETFIIDKNGKILQHLNGAVEWGKPEFTDYIENLLAQPTIAPTTKALPTPAKG
ncbi:MAG: TlpA disulfide reductase family protein [Ghiorsea sp.]